MGLSHFLPRMTKIVKTWQSQKILVERFFWSESIQNVLKRISKRKSQNQNFFPLQNFFVGLSHFLPKITKPQGQNFLTGKNFWFLDFRFKIRFKTFWIDSDQKKFSTKICWLCHFFTILVILGKKWLSPRKKFCNGKKFSISRFSF